MASNPPVQDLNREFLEGVCKLPDGDKINHCIQCGTCSGSCPTASVMQYSPRQIVAAVRAGKVEKVLGSNTAWLCASCYSCAVRCPAKIPFTDIMYELKRLGAKYGIKPGKITSEAMAESFVEVVDKYGRNAEAQLIRKYYFRTNPFKMLGQIPLTMRLISKGRLEFFSNKIKGLEGLRKMVAKVEENGKK